MTKNSGRKVHSDEGIRKLGVGSNLRLIFRGKFEKFDGESPSYYTHYRTSLCNRNPNEQVASGKCKRSVCDWFCGKAQHKSSEQIAKDTANAATQRSTSLSALRRVACSCCQREYNFNNLKDAELERIKLETKYKCNFVIQADISGQIYYIFPDPDDARHEEKFFKYTYVKDSNFDILKS